MRGALTLQMAVLAHLILLALLAGCLQPGDAAEPAAPATERDLAPADPPPGPLPAANVSAPLPVAAPPPARVREAGLSWADCTALSFSAFHHQEWAAGLVPEDYRELNDGAGFGELLFRGLDCQALSVGGASYYPWAQWAFWGVLVEAPPGVQGPAGNVYVLDVVTSDASLQEQLSELGWAAWVGRMDWGESSYSLQSDGPSGTVTEATSLDHTANVTGLNRLHWKAGSQSCWVDLERVVALAKDTSIVLEGTGGTPYTFSGPAHHIGGLGTRATESGHLSPPTCVELP